MVPELPASVHPLGEIDSIVLWIPSSRMYHLAAQTGFGIASNKNEALASSKETKRWYIPTLYHATYSVRQSFLYSISLFYMLRIVRINRLILYDNDYTLVVYIADLTK